MRLRILIGLKFPNIKLNENPYQKFIRTDRRDEVYILVSKKILLQTPPKPFSKKELYVTYNAVRLFSDKALIVI
jgi:hypothetical protein